MIKLNQSSPLARLFAATVLTGATLAGAQAPVSSAPAPCPPKRDAQGNLVASVCAPDTPATSGSAAQRFPYPGDGQPSKTTEEPPTALPSTTVGKAPASKRFPYPGENDKPSSSDSVPSAVSEPNNPPLQDAGSSGQTSSSSSNSADNNTPRQDGAAAPDPGDSDSSNSATQPRSKRHKLPFVPRQTPSEREQEDVQVASFYFNDGNFTASYARAKDAVTLDEEDAAAQFALGNAARKIGKLDESQRAYRRCLELDPVPKIRKPAERALREMAGDS